MDLLIVEPLEAEVMQWLERAPSRALCARARARPARVPPGAVQRARADRPAVGDARRRRRCTTRRCCGRSAGSAPAPRTSTSTPARAPASRSCAAVTASARGRGRVHDRRAAVAAAPRAGASAPTACWSGRELGGATVGLVGMAPAARSMAQLLARLRLARRRLRPGAARAATACGTRWQRRAAGPARAARAVRRACACSSTYFSRYHGLLGERFLPSLQAEPGAGEHRAFGPVRRDGAGRRR